ncbi:MAG: filamentous hemagglutinin N-terminal domain-containing protein [Candidatus Competibacter sp.]|nr:filamentous hemagglutinin N-terminal domain-containing protein [Candidatus Competibacter sp.]MDG4584156.1 filamentous hemagglutinin N-terminal domain-containing protein [Candidatus Competibacter sp.]
MNAFRFIDARRHVIGITGAAAFAMACALPARGGVTTDGTLGQGGALPGPNYQITADLGQQVGGNLFHSFGQFSLHSGESATFSGPNSVNNIIGRVTGGEVSLIDGTIRSTIPGANLYLLNPAGMLFGENARLDVTGSVHVSTADYLRLGDGGRFDARAPADSVLTVAPVAAFGFLGPPAPITVNGAFLRVPDGQTLSLIGGDLTLTDATLYAPAGRINLAAAGSAGEVVPTETDLALRGFGTLGSLTLEHGSAQRPTVNLGDPFGEVELANLDTSGTGGGAIFIRGGQWVSRRGWVFANNYGDQAARGLDIALTGAARFEGATGLTAAAFGAGDAGSIALDVGSLILSGGSQLSSSTFGAGHGGDITLTARDAVTISGTEPTGFSPSGLFATAQTGATGNAGSITLDVGRLDLNGGGQIVSGTLGVGDGGDITLTARDAVTISGVNPTGRYPSGLFSNAQAGATGNAGSIALDVGRLELREGGLIASTTWGAGHGGNIFLTARGAVIVSGTDPTGRYPFPSGLYTHVQTGATGNAGSVVLDVGRLELHGGGLITSATLGAGHGGDITLTARDAVIISGTDPTGDYPSSLFAGAQAGSTGNAGSIVLDVGRLELRGGGLIASATLGAGHGGNITLTVRDSVTISGTTPISPYPSGLFASAEPGSTGDAGDSNITLTTPFLTLTDGGTISTASATTNGGNITLDVDHLRLFNGGAISATVYGGFDTEGGNVTINSGNIVALNGSTITAQANQGRGGNILINAGVFLHDAASTDQVLNASSRITGNDGTVQNNAPNTDLSGSLTVLPTNYLSAADQLGDRCGTSDPDSRGRFIVQGRGGLLPGPDDPATIQPARCRAAPPTLAGATPSPTFPSAPALATAAQSFGDR